MSISSHTNFQIVLTIFIASVVKIIILQYSCLRKNDQFTALSLKIYILSIITHDNMGPSLMRNSILFLYNTLRITIQLKVKKDEFRNCPMGTNLSSYSTHQVNSILTLQQTYSFFSPLSPSLPQSPKKQKKII